MQRQLVGWLRLEPLLGVLVILTVALLASIPVTPGERVPTNTATETAPSPGRGTLRLREAAGRRLVTLHVTPNDVGENRFEVLVQEGTRPLDEVLVRLRTTFLDSDLGTAYLVTEPAGPGRFAGHGALTATGRWRVEVLIRERTGDETSTTFTFQVPLAGASAILREVDAAMNGLTALREENHIGPTTTDSTLLINYAYAAPGQIHLQVETGSESIIVGPRRYDRSGPVESWRSSAFPGPDPYRWPQFDFARQATDVTILGEDVVDTQPVLVLSFLDPSIDAYYRLWVGTHDYLVRKETMMSTGHYMTSYFSDFNGPLRIEPPVVTGRDKP